ncbi:MAG: isocitrate/isopropylmalate dehydrogenase family protein, partial [Clostridia bacterium]|nr:isocitrate/isopropylmalate dehydrogenase family protein [Clostridia bacterium]
MNEYIQSATAQFEQLLSEQIARTARMEELSKPVDYAALDKLIIGVCDGDGIGPIICSEATRVLEILLASEIAGGKVELRRI